MSNQIVISSGAKVRNLDGVLTGTSGIVSSVPLGAANGVATLDSGGKVPVSQLPSSVVTYLGTWNAATNTPTLVNGTGDAGDMYICNVAGTVNFGAGPVTFAVGDWVLYGSGTWQKSNGQNGTVTSVGISRDGDALSITGSPITTAGTINIGFTGSNAQYINGEGDLVTFPSLSGFVTDVTGTAPIVSSGGTTPAISIPAASSTVDGYLDNADWTTFNNKQNAITLTTTGTSGVSTLIGSTLNIPNYSTDLSGYVPYTGATANVNLGTFDLTADVITGATGSFASNGGSNTFAINHSSGSGIALNITKGGNGEGLYINKTSGSGNAATIIGTLNATTLVKSGGTSSQFLKADGSVDASAYITLASLSAGTGISYNNTTGVIASTITQYTDALARAAISLTTTGTSGAATYNSTTGVLNIPNYAPDLSGYVTLATAQTISGAKTFTSNIQLGTIGSGTGSATPLTINLGDTFSNTAGSALKLRLFQDSVGAILGIGVSSNQMDFNVPTGNTYKFFTGAAIFENNVTASALIKTGGTSSQFLKADGSVDSTSYQPTLTNPVTGTGTSQFIPKFTGTGSAIGNSIIEEILGIRANITVSNNNAVGFEATNLNAGASAQSYVSLNSNSGLFNMGKISSGFTPPAWLGVSDAYLFNSSSGNIVIYNGAEAGGLHVKTGGGSATKFLVTSGGLVGIGVNPTVSLDAYRNVAGDSAIRISNDNAGTSATAQFFASNGTNTSQFFHTGINYTGAGVLSGANSSGGIYNVSKDIIFAATVGNIRFATGSINQSMILNTTGNLGLGINTPNFEETGRRVLDINGSSNCIIALSVGGTAKGYIYHSGTSMSVANYTSGERLNFNTRTAGGTDTTWASILSTGTFLVGTDAASAGLTGATVTVRASSNNVGQTAFSIQGFDKKGRWAINGQNGTDNYDLQIYSAPTGAGDWTPRFTIQPDGIVYIGGTVSGGGRLQVNGDVNINGNFKINGTTIGGGGGSGVTGSGTANYMTKWTGASTLGNSLVYDNGSNVIIGATSGTNDSKFEIKGSGVWSGAVITLTNTGTSGKSFSMFSTNTSFTQGASRILFYNGTDNVDLAVITSTGSLLLGSTTDIGSGYKLQVTGSISMAYASFFNFRGSSGAGDVLVDNSGSTLRITGNVSVAGSVTASGGFFDTSDSRLKIVVKDYEQPKGIENVAARMYVKNSRKELGYFAQDLKEILPSAVSEGEDGFLTLSYSQVHTAKIAYLEKEIAELKELIKSLL
jgi:hypothetical protein